MDPRLLRYYNRELQFMREMGAEFAAEFPKVAGRLGLEGLECADPYVERLLEGFAFLAARVQLRIDAEFPRFTQHLLESVYPGYLAPTPSMAVVQFQPDLAEGALAEGFTLVRGTVLRSVLGKSDRTGCEYRTAHATTLWPLEISGVQYLPNTAALNAVALPNVPGAKAAVRIGLRATAGLSFDELALDHLPLYLSGGEGVAGLLYEQLLGNALGVVLRPAAERRGYTLLERSKVRRLGFTDGESLLPVTGRGFQGYRLLHEYFSFAERFMFVGFDGLQGAVRGCHGPDLDLFVLLSRSEAGLENALETNHLHLHCAPAINLFPKRCDRIHLTPGDHEYHVVPDRTRPMDFEVYDVTAVTGFAEGSDVAEPFARLYASSDITAVSEQRAFYTLRRERRRVSATQQLRGPRSSHIGNEVFIALVDPDEAPHPVNLRQLGVEALCTNRDLPLLMAIGKGESDFTLETSAPVHAVRCVAGPTKPRASWAEGDTTWRLISHLSLNYLSLADTEGGTGGEALRELLMLYADIGEPAVRRQIEGVRSISSRPIVRRMPGAGPISFGRGLEVTVSCEESAFHGASVFLLGSVLEEFFARYVSINSFTETVLRSSERGEVMRWPARIGARQTL